MRAYDEGTSILSKKCYPLRVYLSLGCLSLDADKVYNLDLAVSAVSTRLVQQKRYSTLPSYSRRTAFYTRYKMAQSKPVLYSYFRSSCSWRVRIALVYKGIDFECKTVNLLTGDHLKEDFLRMNPCAQVPVLVDKGNALVSSSAILEYLEETVPNPSLLPKDPVTRAKVRELVDGIVAGIQPLQNMKVLKHVGENHPAWAKHWVEAGFSSVERILQDTHGMFCVGDDVTLADVCLVPQIFNANRFKVDMNQFPIINEVASRLNGLKAFKETHPFVQLDCPDDLKISN